jgi:hypothetical protein
MILVEDVPVWSHWENGGGQGNWSDCERYLTSRVGVSCYSNFQGSFPKLDFLKWST